MKRILILLMLIFLMVPCFINFKPILATPSTENFWTAKTSMPQAIPGGKAVAVNGKIFVMGGSLNYEYDPATDNWTAKTPMPTPRQDFAIGAYGSRIYTIGGKYWINNAWVYYSVNEVYDTANDSWEIKTPMPTDRGEVDANVVNGKIYMISGSNDASQAAEVKTVSLNEAYDIDNDSWILGKAIPYPVMDYASTAFENCIYVIGGETPSSTNPSFSNKVQIYNCENDSWTFGASIPSAVIFAAAAATSGLIAPAEIYVYRRKPNSF